MEEIDLIRAFRGKGKIRSLAFCLEPGYLQSLQSTAHLIVQDKILNIEMKALVYTEETHMRWTPIPTFIPLESPTSPKPKPFSDRTAIFTYNQYPLTIPTDYNPAKIEYALPNSHKFGTCGICHGQGTYTCPHCKGKGKDTCVRCFGAKLVRSPHYSTRTASIEYPEHNYTTCPNCDGTGEIKCESCNNGKSICSGCEGKGKAYGYNVKVKAFTPVIERRYRALKSGSLIPSLPSLLDKIPQEEWHCLKKPSIEHFSPSASHLTPTAHSTPPAHSTLPDPSSSSFYLEEAEITQISNEIMAELERKGQVIRSEVSLHGIAVHSFRAQFKESPITATVVDAKNGPIYDLDPVIISSSRQNLRSRLFTAGLSLLILGWIFLALWPITVIMITLGILLVVFVPRASTDLLLTRNHLILQPNTQEVHEA